METILNIMIMEKLKLELDIIKKENWKESIKVIMKMDK